MFAILLDPLKAEVEATEALTTILRSYGVEKVISNGGQKTDFISLVDSRDVHTEVVILGDHPELSNRAIRRLTLSSGRLPSRVIVWDNQSKGHLVAVRVPWCILRQAWLENHNLSIEDAVRSVQSNETTGVITTYTIQQFASADALRLGGSFSKSGIRKHFAKYAVGRGAKKLLNEANFYRTLPASLTHGYPELLFAEENEQGVSLGIDYKEYPNIRDLLLNLQIDPEEAAQLLRGVLDYEYGEALDKHRQPTPPNYLSDYHYHRVWRRIITSSELDPEFDRLINARWVEVNGKRLPNIPCMLYKLEGSAEAAVRLDPGSVSPYIHADLHLENILCDATGGQFWLVDPRGYPVCDIFYDLGKLAHSYNSGYDLLHEGRHEAEVSVDGDTAVINYRFTSTVLRERYTKLNELMKTVIDDVLGGKEKDVALKILFNEAMHFCSDMPFHINPSQTPNVAAPIYAIGAKLLAEVLEMLGIDVGSCVDLQEKGLARLADMGHRPWRFDG